MHLPPDSLSPVRRSVLIAVAASLCLPGRGFADRAELGGPQRDVVYGQGGGKALKLDFYPPSDTGGRGLAPVIVFLHGGGWRIGDKKEIEPYVVRFNEAGYAVVSANYRLSNHGRFPAQIFDCKTAVRWTRAHAAAYGLNPKRIGALGFSAGAHLAALLGTSEGVKSLEDRAEGSAEASSRVRAVCVVSGPTDLTIPPRSLVGKLSIDGLLGGTAKEKSALARSGNPAAYATHDDAPTLLIYGESDDLVPPAYGKILADALHKVGVEVQTVTVRGGGHVPFFAAQQQAALDFFGSHL